MDVYIEDGDIRTETERDATIQRGQQENRRKQILRREVQTKERVRRSMKLDRAAMVAEKADFRREHDLRINPELAIQRRYKNTQKRNDNGNVMNIPKKRNMRGISTEE
jgi:hypothetical protein